MEQRELSRLSRLTAILILLQSKRLVTAADLADKFDISKRTAYRDIRALEEAGVPIFTEEGKGYSLMEGYSLPPVMFSEEEANALITAEKLISRNKDASLVKHHHEAILKIKAVLQYGNKDKADLLSQRVTFIQNYSGDLTSNHVSAIQKAITNLIVLKIDYRALYKNELSSRHVEPLALYHTRENWIMIAWCRLRNDYREFRLDRIEQMQISEENFPDRKFDLIGYFKMQLAKMNP